MATRAESGKPPLSTELPGTWELVSRIDVTGSGERSPDPSLGDDPIAILIYDRSGHFAAQFMKRDRSTAIADAPTGASNNSRARGGYDAYFGMYTVDDALGTVTQRLVGALSRENVGSVLTRGMEVDGDTLTIRLQTTSVAGERITRTLSWRPTGGGLGEMNPASPVALLLIDVQQGLDAPRWGARNNTGAEQQIGAVLAAWRQAKRPVIHVQHMSQEPRSPLRADAPGNLGFEVVVVEDATATFERTGPDGVRYSAEQMHRLALASLHGEFAQVQSAREVLARLPT